VNPDELCRGAIVASVNNVAHEVARSAAQQGTSTVKFEYDYDYSG
jgi:hypothetical protein